MTRPEGRSHRFRAVRPIRRQTGPTDPAGYPLICVPGQFSGETGKAAPIEDPASRGASFGIEGGIAELSARTASLLAPNRSVVRVRTWIIRCLDERTRKLCR